VLYMVLHPPLRSLPSFLQSTLRFRMARAIRFPFTFDTLSEMASAPFELAAIAWHWSEWVRWSRTQAKLPR
jgi:hypothetical protein